MGGFTDMMSPPPAPPTALGKLRILSEHAGIRCSPLIFGGISCGTAWDDYQPPADRETSFKLLDAFIKAGGNTIDTANGYQNEESETIIGEWMKERDNRDRLVIATKFTADYQSYKYGKNESTNLAGNSKKSLRVSLRASLKKLQTDYVDLLYIHWWDWTTSIPELMDSLDVEVKAGRVLYLGASDMPAWVVAGCNEYARAHGKTQFAVAQTLWSVMERDVERDTLPMARNYGMALVPWSVLGSGKLKNPKQLQKAIDDGSLKEDSEEVRVSRAISEIAKKRGIDSFAPIALAYVMHKYPRVFPIIGFQTEEQLHDNIRALDISLTDEEVDSLERIKPVHMGFPHDMIGYDPALTGKPGGNNALQLGTVDYLVDRKVVVSQLK